MAIYYIDVKINDTPTLFSLDATTEISVNYTSRIVSHPVEEGSDISDHIINQNKSVTLIGYISDIKSVSNKDNLSVKDYLEGLEKVRNDKTLFTLHYSNELPPLVNCFFESVDISQDSNNGTFVAGERTLSSYKVKFSINQLRLSSGAILSTIRADEIKDITQTKKDTAGASTFADPKWDSDTLIKEGEEMIDSGVPKVPGFG